MNDIQTIIGSMLRGQMSDTEILEVFTELDSKELTSDMLYQAATAMRESMIEVTLSGDPIDTCGTGGSGKKTINTSTIVALIVAAAGANVAKHGNKSASGNCGCFDLLEALDIQIELTPIQEQKIYEELGIVFLYAKSHHPAMRHVSSARKLFGKKTIFNHLGPLCNPANVQKQLIGTSSKTGASLMIDTLSKLGMKDAIIVHGEDGLDEISLCAPTHVQRISTSETMIFTPEDVGKELVEFEHIEGGTIEENVEITNAILDGHTGPHTNLVLLNAAHALLLTELANTIKEGLEVATSTLQSGAAKRLLTRYKEASHDIL